MAQFIKLKKHPDEDVWINSNKVVEIYKSGHYPGGAFLVVEGGAHTESYTVQSSPEEIMEMINGSI